MIHSRLNNAFILFIMEIEFNIDWINLVFSIDNITPVKYNLGNVFKLLCKSANSISRNKLF